MERFDSKIVILPLEGKLRKNLLDIGKMIMIDDLLFDRFITLYVELVKLSGEGANLLLSVMQRCHLYTIQRNVLLTTFDLKNPE